MSTKALEAFRALIAEDAALQKVCAEAIAAREPQRVVDAAAQRGYAFTVAELEKCVADGELSDTELELVSGGVVMPPSFDKKTSSGFGR